MDGHEVLTMPRQRKPEPWPCAGCGEPSHYGYKGWWYCTTCWQARFVAMQLYAESQAE
jgi:hypothetical protein